MAVVGGKRLSSCFEETNSSPAPHHASYWPGAAAAAAPHHHLHHHPYLSRCSPVKRQRTGAFGFAAAPAAFACEEDASSSQAARSLRRQLQILLTLLPDMAEQRIQEELVAANGDLEAALARLSQLQLGGGNASSSRSSAVAGEHSRGAEERGEGCMLRSEDAQAGNHRNSLNRNGAEGIVEQADERTTDATVRKFAQVLVDELGSVQRQREEAVDVVEQYMNKLLQYRDKQAHHETEKQANGHDEEMVRRALNENSVLKRAVQIQNAKIHALEGQVHTLTAEAQREAEGRHLAEKARHDVERKNYLLQVHLQAAMPSGGVHFPGNGPNGPPPPDVF